MGGILSFISKTIAFGFAVLFVIVCVFVMLLFGAEWRLFDPDVYKRALASEDIYARLPGLVAEQLVRAATYNPCRENPEDWRCKAEGEGAPSESEQTGGPPPYFKMLTQSDWEALLSSLLSPAWLQAQTESVIDQVFAYLNSSDATLRIQVSWVDLKKCVAGEEGLQAILRMMRALPPCTDEQLANLNRALARGDVEKILTCRPPEQVMARASGEIKKALSALVAKMPDEYDSQDELSLPAERREGPAGAIVMLKQIRPFVYLILLLPAALLLLVTLFGVRSFKCWLRWWGIPFLFVGLIAGGLAVIALPLLDWGTAMMLARDRLSVSAFSSNLLQTALNLGRSVVREYVGALGLQAALIGLSGFGMLLFSFFIRSKPKAQRLRRVA